MSALSRGLACAGLLVMAGAASVRAERAPVLGQIDLPHPYYYREMFLPQLTSGPSAVAWMPDSREVVFSMGGTLWRQKVPAPAGAAGVSAGAVAVTAPAAPAVEPAEQLTSPDDTYDYQPDVSADGRWVIYAAYGHDAVELRALDLRDRSTHALTQNGAVNVEPRFAPDGRRVVFTSTAYHKRFHVFVADFDTASGRLGTPVRVTGERRSPLPRYYYSPFDHEINPVFTRDGRHILYVSNRNHLYGTGGFWRLALPAHLKDPGDAAPDDGAEEIHYEETNWKARPDVSPDGSRLIYSSYLGQSWHNLWLLPATGGDAFPLTYGAHDSTYARWSPDGQRIAFVTNQSGATGLALVEVPGGLVTPLPIGARHYLKAQGQLEIELTDGKDAGHARVSVTDAHGLAHAPVDAWMNADDGFDRTQRAFEQHYFHAAGKVSLDVPAGPVTVRIVHGMERAIEQQVLEVKAGATARIAVNLADGAFTVPAPGRWVSADVHVHMNYGGTYRNDPAHLVTQALGENLNLVHDLIVNKEQRYPDIAYSGRQLDPASVAQALVVHGQEYHTSYWGHLGLLDIGGGIILPGYAGYPHTAASSLYPMNADVADIGHARGALVGYVHPFDEPPEPVTKPTEPLTDELPVDVALGKVDYMEILGFSDHRATAGVWYRLLNLGFHLPAAGGTDAMANFASLRGPVGMNRVYVRMPDGAPGLDQAAGVAAWLAALKAGHSMATNGPLLGFELGGRSPGDTLELTEPKRNVRFTARLRSLVPVDHLELVCDGQPLRELAPRHAPAGTGARHPVETVEVSGSVALYRDGWCLLRASTDGAREEVLDNYVYATTSPVFVRLGASQPHSPEDARFFEAWMDRLTEAAQKYPDWNNAAERRGVLERIAQAKQVYAGME